MRHDTSLASGALSTHIALIAAVVDRYAPCTPSSVAQVCNLRQQRFATCVARALGMRAIAPAWLTNTKGSSQRRRAILLENPPRHTCRQRDYTRSSDRRTAGDCRIMPWRCVSGQTIMKKIADGASAQSLNACITVGAVSEGAPPRSLAMVEMAESHADATETSGWRLVAGAGVGGVLLLGAYPVGNKAP